MPKASRADRLPGAIPVETADARELRRLRSFARMLDSSVRIPGTSFRVGLDPLIGLVPGVGDLVGAGLSIYLVRRAWHLGIPRHVRAKMLWNIGVEALVGAIPIVGDVFDAAFKANNRNVRLLERALAKRQSSDAPA